MKKLFTLLTLATMLIGGVLSSSARVFYGTESDVVAGTSILPNGGVTADGNVLTFPNAWWNGLTIDASKGVDPQKYGKFSYTVDSWAIGSDEQSGVPFRIELLDADGTNLSTIYGQTSVTIPTNCTKIVLNASAPDTKVTNLQITMGNKVISGTDDGMASLIELPSNNAGTWANGIPAFPKTLPQATVLFGNGEGSGESVWADITGYEKLSIVVSDVTKVGSQLRVWMWNGSGVTTLYPHLESEYESVTDWTAVNSVSTTGTYVVKLPVGYKLKGIKTNWDGAECTVSDVYLTEYASYPDLILYPINAVNNLTGVGKSWADITFPCNISNSAFWGSHDPNINNYVDISGCNTIVMDLETGNDQFRAFVWNEETNSRDILYFYPEDAVSPNYKVATATNGKGRYVVDVRGYSKLMGVKPYGGGGKINLAYVTKDGYADVAVDEARTFSSSSILDFSEVTDVEAYIATNVTESKVTMKKVTGAVPANTGIVLKQASNKEVLSIPTCGAATEDVSANLLVATTASTNVPAGAFVLAGSAETLGWYYIGANAATLPAGKAYLAAPTAAKQLQFVWGDDATQAVDAVAETKAEDGAWYTVTGVKVAAPANGLYIHNGKKVSVNK